MGDMTEHFRDELDKLNVHWWEGDGNIWPSTCWESNGLTWEYVVEYDGEPNWRGYLWECFDAVTPEQAIAATLGADAKPTRAESSDTCHNTSGNSLYFVCSGCGDNPLVIRPNYCPNCGRRVVEMSE